MYGGTKASDAKRLKELEVEITQLKMLAEVSRPSCASTGPEPSDGPQWRRLDLHRPGSPWQNAWIESFNGHLRDEPLNGWYFDSLLEAKVLIEDWRIDYTCMHRPHSAHGDLTSSGFAEAWINRHH